MIFIILFLLLFLIFCYYNNKGVPVFLYHSVSNTSNVTKEIFKNHLEIIKKYKMTTITATQYYHGNIKNNSMLLTFDDGYLDNYTVVFPLLKQYNMKATIFLTTSLIGNHQDYMNWTQIQEMYKSGLVDFGLHTHTHETIDVYNGKKDSLANLIKNTKKRGAYSGRAFYIKSGEICYESYDSFKNRINDDYNLNKNSLSSHLSYKPIFFAWPFGHKNHEALEILKKDGVIGFFSTKKGTNSKKPNWDYIKRVELRNFSSTKFKINLLICKNLILGNIYRFLS